MDDQTSIEGTEQEVSNADVMKALHAVNQRLDALEMPEPPAVAAPPSAPMAGEEHWYPPSAPHHYAPTPPVHVTPMTRHDPTILATAAGHLERMVQLESTPGTGGIMFITSKRVLDFCALLRTGTLGPAPDPIQQQPPRSNM